MFCKEALEWGQHEGSLFIWPNDITVIHQPWSSWNSQGFPETSATFWDKVKFVRSRKISLDLWILFRWSWHRIFLEKKGPKIIKYHRENAGSPSKGDRANWIPTIFKVPGWGWWKGWLLRGPHPKGVFPPFSLWFHTIDWVADLPRFRTWFYISQFHEPLIISLAGLLRYLLQVAISDFGPTIPYLWEVLASHLAKKNNNLQHHICRSRNRFLVNNTVFLVHSFRFESHQFLTFTWQTPEMWGLSQKALC